jgi:hypothetical protein
MSKIIKLKQSDIENIVKNIIKEAPEFDTQIEPEELPGADNPDINDPELNPEDATLENPYGEPGEIGVALGKDGKYYVADIGTGEILGIK